MIEAIDEVEALCRDDGAADRDDADAAVEARCEVWRSAQRHLCAAAITDKREACAALGLAKRAFDQRRQRLSEDRSVTPIGGDQKLKRIARIDQVSEPRAVLAGQSIEGPPN